MTSKVLHVLCWRYQSGAQEGFPLDRKRERKKKKKRKTHSWLHMEGWVMDSCPHVLFRGGLFHLESKGPVRSLLSPQAYTLWLRASQQAEKDNNSVTPMPRPVVTGWTAALMLELQSQGCYLCAGVGSHKSLWDSPNKWQWMLELGQLISERLTTHFISLQVMCCPTTRN